MDQDNTQNPADPTPAQPAESQQPEQPQAEAPQPAAPAPAPAAKEETFEVKTPEPEAAAPAAEAPAEEAPATPAPTPEAIPEPTPEPAPEPAMPAPEAPAAEPAAPAEAPMPAAEPEQTPAPEAAAPAPAQPASPEVPTGPCCETVKAADWDKKMMTLDKQFYKTFSPRLFYKPFSFAIDLDRAKQGAMKKGYQVVENGMMLDTGGMFWATLMVEITGGNESDKNVVSLAGKQVYTKASTRPWKELREDFKELEAELGHKPKELYMWWTACPQCMNESEVKTVFVAVMDAQKEATPQQPTEIKPDSSPAVTPPSTPAAPTAEQPASEQPPQTPQA